MPTKFGKCSPQPHSCFCCWPCRLIVVLRMGRSSVYLWILPMFHACGWTYPWAITFAFGAQVSSCSLVITHVADLISLKDHAADCGPQSHLGPSSYLWSNSLLCGSNCPSALYQAIISARNSTFEPMLSMHTLSVLLFVFVHEDRSAL